MLLLLVNVTVFFIELHRSAVECDLQMLGLIIMQNTLKPQTTPVIAKLKKADLRVVMVTGKIQFKYLPLIFVK